MNPPDESAGSAATDPRARLSTHHRTTAPRTWHHAPETAHEAGVVAARSARRVREQILDHLARVGAHGATAREIAAALGMSERSTIAARVTDLAHERRIRWTGARRHTGPRTTARVYALPVYCPPARASDESGGGA